MSNEPVSSILVPAGSVQGVPCGFCPRRIFKHNEAKGRLFIVEGRAICAVCRVLRGNMGDIIRAGTIRRKADKIVIEKRKQSDADQIAAIVAEASQRKTRSKMKKHKK